MQFLIRRKRFDGVWGPIFSAEKDQFGRMFIKTEKWCQLLSPGFYEIVGGKGVLA